MPREIEWTLINTASKEKWRGESIPISDLRPRATWHFGTKSYSVNRTPSPPLDTTSIQPPFLWSDYVYPLQSPRRHMYIVPYWITTQSNHRKNAFTAPTQRQLLRWCFYAGWDLFKQEELGKRKHEFWYIGYRHSRYASKEVPRKIEVHRWQREYVDQKFKRDFDV